MRVQVWVSCIRTQALITVSTSPTCPTCGGGPETVVYYLLARPTYSIHRAVHFRALGHSGRTLATLLNKPDALCPLFAYINASGRFRGVLGSIDGPDDDAAQ